MKSLSSLLGFAAVALSLQGAAAAELGPLEVAGLVGVETRVFPWQARFAGQQGHGEISLIVNPEFRYRSSGGQHQFSFIPYFRLDSRDGQRSHFDIREAYWLYKGGSWEVLTGFDRVFWGVTESSHLVNVINQLDLVEDLDGEDYLGQPMINFTTFQDWGQIDLYLLPGFRERTFAGREGRLRAPIPVETSQPVYTSGLGQKHVDVAARYSHYFGDLDIGLYYFWGTGREPTLEPNEDFTGLVPRYDVINQGGLDLQYTKDAWLFKFEGIIRQGQGKTFGALVAGVEYTLYQIFGAADLGLLVEYLHDGRDANAPLTAFEDDIFAGMRLALNDVQDTSLLVGAIVDPSSSETFYTIEAERRLGQHLVIELRARFFTGANPGQTLFSISRDDYIQVRLARYF